MGKYKSIAMLGLVVSISFVSQTSMAQEFVEGIPVLVQKSDWSSNHLIYIQMKTPVTTTAQCTSKAGVVIDDANESAKAALTMAMTALASGLTFRCYIDGDRCSRITGATATYPVCDYYPSLKK